MSAEKLQFEGGNQELQSFSAESVEEPIQADSPAIDSQRNGFKSRLSTWFKTLGAAGALALNMTACANPAEIQTHNTNEPEKKEVLNNGKFAIVMVSPDTNLEPNATEMKVSVVIHYLKNTPKPNEFKAVISPGDKEGKVYGNAQEQDIDVNESDVQAQLEAKIPVDAGSIVVTLRDNKNREQKTVVKLQAPADQWETKDVEFGG